MVQKSQITTPPGMCNSLKINKLPASTGFLAGILQSTVSWRKANFFPSDSTTAFLTRTFFLGPFCFEETNRNPTDKCCGPREWFVGGFLHSQKNMWHNNTVWNFDCNSLRFKSTFALMFWVPKQDIPTPQDRFSMELWGPHFCEVMGALFR